MVPHARAVPKGRAASHDQFRDFWALSQGKQGKKYGVADKVIHGTGRESRGAGASREGQQTEEGRGGRGGQKQRTSTRHNKVLNTPLNSLRGKALPMAL